MRVVFYLIVLITLSGCVIPKQLRYEQGINSFRHHDYRIAFVRLLPEAMKGKPDAQYAVGYMYYYGEGVTENRSLACQWIARAAKAGQPDAIKAMALLHLS